MPDSAPTAASGHPWTASASANRALTRTTGNVEIATGEGVKPDCVSAARVSSPASYSAPGAAPEGVKTSIGYVRRGKTDHRDPEPDTS